MDLSDEAIVPANAKTVGRRAQTFTRENIEPVAGVCFESREYPIDVVEVAHEEELVAQEISAEYGGVGHSLNETVAAAEEFFHADAGIGLILMGQSFGTGILEQFRMPHQKETYLRSVAEGDAITGMTISEPETGSDLAGIEATAVRDGDEWVLDGGRYWIGNGVEADWILVYVRTEESDKPHDNHPMVIVPTDSGGYDAEHVPEKIGMHASEQSHITFTDYRVPRENLVGERGNGFRVVAEFFNHGRTRVTAQGIGLAATVIEETWEFVHEKEELGRPVSDFQSVRHDLAQMRTKFESARTLLWHTVERMESGEDAAKWSSMAKLRATKTAAECAGTAVRLHGGHGLFDESRIGRIYRDVRVLPIHKGMGKMQYGIIYENFQSRRFFRNS